MKKPVHISETEMREHLRETFSQDPEQSFLAAVARHLTDPATPANEKGWPRPHPLWLRLGALLSIALLVFLYFTFGRS
jgi:hypothetical protein